MEGEKEYFEVGDPVSLMDWERRTVLDGTYLGGAYSDDLVEYWAKRFEDAKVPKKKKWMEKQRAQLVEDIRAKKTKYGWCMRVRLSDGTERLASSWEDDEYAF